VLLKLEFEKFPLLKFEYGFIITDSLFKMKICYIEAYNKIERDLAFHINIRGYIVLYRFTQRNLTSRKDPA